MAIATSDLGIQCSCGKVTGTLSNVTPRTGTRCICYCRDCQSFAHFLGHADEILDAHGGTEIFAISPKRIRFAQGEEHVVCMSLKPGGLLRWYADCCNTPIGNTPRNPGMPYAGMIHSCIGEPTDGRRRLEVLGPVRAGVMARSAKGNRSDIDAHDRVPMSLLLRVARMLLMARLRGDHKHSPFFDAQSHEPRVSPRVLSDDELRAVELARG